jgi:hypothetical protein
MAGYPPCVSRSAAIWSDYGVSLNGGTISGVCVQLLQIGGVALDPRPSGANNDAAVVLLGRFDSRAIGPVNDECAFKIRILLSAALNLFGAIPAAARSPELLFADLA